MTNKKPDLFVGLTSWNSALFLPVSLKSIFENTKNTNIRVVVLDNESTDDSAKIAKSYGAEVIFEKCSQPDALNKLMEMSDAPYTLLLHADVVILDSRWFELVRSKLINNIILVSPEDIGCGPYSRPFGIDMPESSFIFFDTVAIRKTKMRRWHRYGWLRFPKNDVDFYGNHVTHNLPQRLSQAGFSWHPMLVHCSESLRTPIYEPQFTPCIWTTELGHMQYGLGNFYSIDGVVTHYHNWYERVDLKISASSKETTEKNGVGFPVAYVKTYTEAFLNDYKDGCVSIPKATKSSRVPMAL